MGNQPDGTCSTCNPGSSFLMLTDYDLAIQCQRVYNGAIPVVNVAGIDYAVVINPDETISVIFEGSHDIEDAKRDLEALMIPVPWLGRVHGGAWQGILDAADAIKPRIDGGKLIRISGHSLGAMRACYMACVLYGCGYRNLEVVTFGCPLWGDAQAVTYCNQVKNRTYQNYKNLFQHDFFTLIPLHLELEPYMPPPNRNRFWSAPTANNEYKPYGEMIECHSLADCYIPGLRSVFP